MGSLRFPFSFPPPNKNNTPTTSRATTPRATTAAVACAVAAGAATFSGLSAAINNNNQNAASLLDLVFASKRSLLPWASLSLTDTSAPAVEPKTGTSFPAVVCEKRRLLGVGLRRKRILGLKNIDVYAFGVYADEDEAKQVLTEKYGQLPSSELTGKKEFNYDFMEEDIPATIRLQIVYGKLSIGSVRSAFEESVGSRLQKFGGPDNKELLQRFTSQFKDEYKIPRGSVIELSREQGHVLKTTIDGKEVGSIQSKLLCWSILDLYIGEDPFDRQAKEDVESKLASLIQKNRVEFIHVE